VVVDVGEVAQRLISFTSCQPKASKSIQTTFGDWAKRISMRKHSTWPRFLTYLPAVGLLFGCSGPPTPGQLPRTYDAPQATSPINLDGDPSDPAWAVASWTEDFVDIRRQARSEDSGNPEDALHPKYRTRAKLLWDDEYLYIAAILEEPHLWATLLERDAIIYRDDDFEVFLDPDRDGLAYFELEINALGTEFDLFLNKPYKDGGMADIAWDIQGLRTGVWLMGTINDPMDKDRGWSVEIGIPWTALVSPQRPPVGTPRTRWQDGSPPRPGDTWRINFSRVDWPLIVVDGEYRKAAEPTRSNPHPESNWVWSPQGTINMHIPEMWGMVRFVESRRP